jgi:hypothetical protein
MSGRRKAVRPNEVWRWQVWYAARLERLARSFILDSPVPPSPSASNVGRLCFRTILEQKLVVRTVTDGWNSTQIKAEKPVAMIRNWLFSGGAGNRTPVPKHFGGNFYVCSRSILTGQDLAILPAAFVPGLPDRQGCPGTILLWI